MKAAIYINEGVTQVVLTGESEWERNALKMILNAGQLRTYEGGFYECQGGWYRESNSYERSLIFRIEKAMEVPMESMSARYPEVMP